MIKGKAYITNIAEENLETLQKLVYEVSKIEIEPVTLKNIGSASLVHYLDTDTFKFVVHTKDADLDAIRKINRNFEIEEVSFKDFKRQLFIFITAGYKYDY